MNVKSLRSRLNTSINDYISKSSYLRGTGNNAGLEQISNPKWIDFEETGIRRKEGLVNNSVAGSLMHQQDGSAYPSMLGGRFNPFGNVLYATLDASKANRVYEWRLMSTYPTVSDAIDEIAQSFISLDENSKLPAKFTYEGENVTIEDLDELDKEFKYIMSIFDFKKNGTKWCSDFLIDGELFLEHIINNEKEEYKRKGILGVQKLPTELTDAIFKDKINGIITAFVGKNLTFDQADPEHILNISNVPYQVNQVFYVNSENWDPSGEFLIPYIERARKRYVQLSYLEDSIVIYRLVRAPERLVFTADCKNMDSPHAEAYLNRIKNNVWKSKSFDLNVADITQRFEPQAMLDAYFFAKTQNNEGITVTQLPGGANLGQLDDLNYFKQALYESLHVPVSRLQHDKAAVADPSQTLQEELKFAEMIIGIQRKFAEAVKQTFITHLKLKGTYQRMKLKEPYFNVEFYPPSNYYQFRQLQAIQLRADVMGKLAGIDCISTTWALKKIMGFNDNEILRMMEFKKLEAANKWTLAQIENGGPNWQKEQLQNLAQTAGAGAEGGMPGDMGGGMGGDMGGMDFGGGDMSGDMGGEMPPEGEAPSLESEVDAAEDVSDMIS